VHRVDVDTALARLGVLAEVRRAHPTLPVYGFSVIMRLAPTADGTNEAWREKLARFAELSRGPNSDAESRELDALRAAIPEAAREDYLRARARNRRVNLAALDLVSSKVLDYLVVSQDDARPRGLHLADRAEIAEHVRKHGVTARVGIQPGADEVAMLLLARAVLERHGFSPTMRVTYSSELARSMVAPFEDRPLHETASFQIAAAGARDARTRAGPADLDLFVFASRHDEGAPAAFASRVTAAVKAGARAIVADVDPKGDIQGASPVFTEALLAAKVFPSLYGYASWNTAGNTLGSVLATACVPCDDDRARQVALAHHLLEDWGYQAVVRDDLRSWLSETFGAPAIPPAYLHEATAFTTAWLEPIAQRIRDAGLPCAVSRVRHPWRRTFEVDFDLD